MMAWFDHFSLAAIIVIPLIGGVFLLFIPGDDAVLRKRVALFVVLVATVFHARNAFLLFSGKLVSLDLAILRPAFVNGSFQLRLDLLSFIALSHLLLIVILLLYSHLTRNAQPFTQVNAKALIVLAMASAGILIDNFALILLIQYAILQTLLVINLHDGGHHRSSSALITSVFFTFVDLCAFFAWTWRPDLSVLILLPWVTRLMFPFFSPWARTFFANSTVEITILYLGSSFILGVTGLARASIESPLLSYVALIAAFFGALLSLSDRHRAQFLLRVASIGGALCFAVLADSPNANQVSKTLLYAGSLVLIVSLALLLQRAMSERAAEKSVRGLHLLWFCVLALLCGIPFVGVGAFLWDIFPSASFPWFIVYAIAIFGLSLRVRESIPLQSTMQAPTASPLPTSSVVNAWCCFSLVIGTSIVFQFIFTSLVRAT